MMVIIYSVGDDDDNDGRITLLVVFSICRNYEESYRKGVGDMNDLVRGHETKVG